MDSIGQPLIRAVRRFNRFYTNILGLLDQHLPDSEFSLPEARVLYEIGHTENCTAKNLSEELRIDPGYLSRMVKHFEKRGLTYRVQSAKDGRQYYLYLTEQGQDILAKLGRLSDGQIDRMLNRLPDHDRKRLVEGMQTIEDLLSTGPELPRDRVIIRSELKPGDIGALIHLHGWIYAEECGYNHVFEGYVCKTFYHFLENYHPERDRVWFAEADGTMIGAIAIVGHSAEKAQLRWFILHPQYRGIGLGGKLLQEALQYCREKGFRTVFLETTADQQTAIRMYRKAGFQKVAEHPNHSWGKELVEQTFELVLP
ncbi:MarR family transcriptional regulator with acetyltransferase activity [Hydrogenispora ethanolica]|jgi:DNA-binding MarR family transcriptional regulator/GNAT superfamily N-acetyltransferase|uniref:MarR family transcriptional regulator with acetyltransferase activity n=1 Tax=Hydrogenispora ethanolica TaxID=1082276 RepID=A0A4R1R038_HYDET|nr:helix-turn-helix domain-containing GNAT family N-acetyltransferase [Hydrogenispora ethanolica]TCL58645.1 MarR family transcriptional regulator with acetyltransferase activity [Hydrogenispora ethanolica]